MGQDHSRYELIDRGDYFVVQATCKDGHLLTGYGEDEEEATAQLLDELGLRRGKCDGCGLLGLFG